MNQKRDPVGVFDSGAGGISTLREMIRELPDERFIYFGDMANAPYGTKSTEEVVTCVRSVVGRLMEQNIKALVIACNTATGAAAAVLRDELTIPVVGMEPALKPASKARKNGSVLVLATPLTLHALCVPEGHDPRSAAGTHCHHGWKRGDSQAAAPGTGRGKPAE